jgi:hypothetical protein
VSAPGSYPKYRNRRSEPSCDEGGLPGALIALRLRMLVLARWRMNAPAFDRTARRALSTARMTFALSKKNCLTRMIDHRQLAQNNRTTIVPTINTRLSMACPSRL